MKEALLQQEQDAEVVVRRRRRRAQRHFIFVALVVSVIHVPDGIADSRGRRSDRKAAPCRRLDRRRVAAAHRLDFNLEADFNRMGLGSYSKLRMVKNSLMLCDTYPLEMLFSATLTRSWRA